MTKIKTPPSTTPAPTVVTAAPLDQVERISPVCLDDGVDDCKTDESRSKMPCVEEAIVLTQVQVVNTTRTVSDPLIVTGTAIDGAKIRVHNASMKGWPVVGEAVAEGGRFHVQVDDLSKFARGDQVVVTGQQGKRPTSFGVLKETTPVLETTTTTRRIHNNQLVSSNTSVSTTLQPRNADDRVPFYDRDRVSTTPRYGISGVHLELRGGCKALPPKAKIWGESFGTATANDDGSFELSLAGLPPGGGLALTVEDIHGKRSRTLINVPTRRSQIVAALANATRQKDAIEIDVKTDFSKGDVFVFLGKDGEPQRLEVQDGGQLCGSLKDMPAGAVMQLGVEVQGVRSKQLMPMVATAKGLLVLDNVAKESGLVPALAAATYKTNNGGGLEIPQFEAMPPGGYVEISRAGQLAYRLAADEKGVVPTTQLTGTMAGELLSFKTFDAGGRSLGYGVSSYCIPDAGECVGFVNKERDPKASSLGELVALIGTGHVGPGEPLDKAIKLSANLGGNDRKALLGSQDEWGRVELGAPYPVEESGRWGMFDGATMSVNEFPDRHYRALNFFLQMNNNRSDLDVRVPLPKDGEPFKLFGDMRLPDIATIRKIIPRVTAFANLVANSGGRVGHPGYDGAMHAIHSLIYALDVMAVQNQDIEKEAKELGLEFLNQLPFEQVDALKYVPGQGTEGATTSEANRDFWSLLDRQHGTSALGLRLNTSRLFDRR